MAQLSTFVVLCCSLALLSSSATADTNSQNHENESDNEIKLEGDRFTTDYLILRSLEKIVHKINSLSQKVDEYGEKQKGLVSSYQTLAASQKEQNNKIAELSQKADEYGEKQKDLVSSYQTLAASQKEQNNKIAEISKEINSTQKLLRNQGYGVGRWVFHVKSRSGNYKLTHSGAVTACRAKGAVLATKKQLEVAKEFGMAVCACGWLADKTVYYPTQWPRRGCGNNGLNSCSWRSTWDAYCFLPYYDGPTTVYY